MEFWDGGKGKEWNLGGHLLNVTSAKRGNTMIRHCIQREGMQAKSLPHEQLMLVELILNS